MQFIYKMFGNKMELSKMKRSVWNVQCSDDRGGSRHQQLSAEGGNKYFQWTARLQHGGGHERGHRDDLSSDMLKGPETA